MGTAMPVFYRGGVECGPAVPGGDVISAHGPDIYTIISDKVFDLRHCPKSDQDEVISGVNGARVKLSNCLILGGIKVLLAGNGDHPGNDGMYARWEIEDCVIIGGGRRCAEAQDCAQVIMRRCWIHDWGRAFDVRAFGSWAHRGGRITAEDCIFTQSGGLFGLGLRNTVVDVANHIGQAVNDNGLAALLRPRTYLPGVCRGLTADTGGLVLATRCYRNRPWIRIDGCNDYMDRASARRIVGRIAIDMPAAAHDLLGQGLVELFDAVC